MAEQSVLAYNCPECGGSMVFNPSKGKMQCEYCDSLFTREEVESTSLKKSRKWLTGMQARIGVKRKAA